MELTPELIRKHKSVVEATVKQHKRTSEKGKIYTVKQHERDMSNKTTKELTHIMRNSSNSEEVEAAKKELRSRPSELDAAYDKDSMSNPPKYVDGKLVSRAGTEMIKRMGAAQDRGNAEIKAFEKETSRLKASKKRKSYTSKGRLRGNPGSEYERPYSKKK